MVCSLGETIVRAALRELFPGESFHAARNLPWLTRAGGSPWLEIDCWSEKQQIAAEYQGQQHYGFNPMFHQSIENYESQAQRDQLKRDAADRAFIYLIEVPYTVSMLKVRAYVREQVLYAGFDDAVVPTESDAEFYARIPTDGVHAAQMLEKASELLRPYKAKCLSNEYLGVHFPLDFECAGGHRFQLTYYELNQCARRKGTLCVECDGKGTRLRDFGEDAEAVAEAGYELLRVEMVRIGTRNQSNKRFFMLCPAKHEFEALRTNFLPITRGRPKHGCAVCNLAEKKNRTAAEFGLEALSPIGKVNENVQWRCLEKKHEFARSWGTIQRRVGIKCPECAKGV